MEAPVQIGCWCRLMNVYTIEYVSWLVEWMGVYSAVHYWRVSGGPIHLHVGLMHICCSRFSNLLIGLWQRAGNNVSNMMPYDAAVPGKASFVKWPQPCLQGSGLCCGWVWSVCPGPPAYIPWHHRQAHTCSSKVIHQLINLALRGLCLCVIAPSEGGPCVYYQSKPLPL